MPYEPEDAPWKKNESSGIRKLFSVVTRRVSKVSQNIVATGHELGLKYPSSPTK